MLLFSSIVVQGRVFLHGSGSEEGAVQDQVQHDEEGQQNGIRVAQVGVLHLGLRLHDFLLNSFFNPLVLPLSHSLWLFRRPPEGRDTKPPRRPTGYRT